MDTYEKKYNEAIKRAKQHCADYVVETIFPELKESEGDRTRKALINFLHEGNPFKNIKKETRQRWIAWLEKQGEQQDVSIQINPSEYINDMGGNGCYLKNTTQASAWSEEDEVGLGDAMWAIEQTRAIAKDENDMGNLWYAERWLKHLKERFTWKPSDEQIKVLNEVLYFSANHESPYWNDYIFGTLNNLIRQLKKLREE